jgi:hypothetical protein
LPGLIKTVIKVNGAYYAGEDDNEYTSSFTGVGWTDYKGNRLHGLKFVANKDSARVIEGYRCLKSDLDRILLRLKDGVIEFHSIEIIKL